MTATALDADALEALLVFYRDAGVDLALADEPVNWLARGEAELEARRQAAPRREPAVARPQPVNAAGAPPAPEAAVVAAREAARSAASLDELKAIVEAFDGCALKATASRTVFEDGERTARIMFVGEAPGRDEDLAGKPFVGRSGQLLDRMMAAIGLDRASNAYIANIIPWRPPGNRTPTPQEIAICEPFIRRQIALKAPDLLVCVGAPSTETLLGLKGIMKSRGRIMPFDTGAGEIKAIATLHPAYLLRSPIAKRLAWRDMLTIRKALGI